MKIFQALEAVASQMHSSKITFPRLEAEILLSSILKKPREFLFIHPEIKIKPSQNARFRRLVKKRLSGYPLAYLIGYREFYGLTFKVNQNVLVPRPETELLVEAARERIKSEPGNKTVIDVGTGSGCIIISLIKQLASLRPGRSFKFMATDISRLALTIAQKNALIHKVGHKIKFSRGNLLEPLLNSEFSNPGSDLIILANLPYGWPGWKKDRRAIAAGIKFEPPLALFAGRNGLALYRKIFSQIKRLNQRRSGSAIRVYCEIDPRQKKAMVELLKKHLPQAVWTIKKDLAGLWRLVEICLPPIKPRRI